MTDKPFAISKNNNKEISNSLISADFNNKE